MSKFTSKMKRPLLAAALLVGLGMGVASAYDACYPCVTPVVVRTVRTVQVCDPCARPRRVSKRRVVYRSYPVVYREVVSAPVYREVVSSPVVYSCSACD